MLSVVYCTLDMRFAPGNADQAVQLLLSSAGRTEAARGCQSCMVARDAGDPLHVRYSETWTTEQALRKHVQSEDFRRVLAAMDMCCETPEVMIGNLSAHSSIAYLQELREQP